MKRAKIASTIKTPTTICRQLRRLFEIGDRNPRLGFAIAWGYYSLRQLRRLVEWFPSDHWFADLLLGAFVVSLM